jgi:hypothetical protein
LRAITALRSLAWASLAAESAKTSIPPSMVADPLTLFLRRKLNPGGEESV